MGTAHVYLDAILQRARTPMGPMNFEADWNDAPRKNKFYRHVEYVPLPGGTEPSGATVEQGLYGTGATSAMFSLSELADMLLESYGQQSRRLAVHANDDLGGLPVYQGATWARGTASGGGLYPVGIYWVTGASGETPPGVYYYSTAHHAMQRLLTGDVTAEVRAALDGADGGADQFLVLGVKFWQNAFKYSSFSYHAVSMDIGTIVASWRIWAQARGLRIAPVLWFDERHLGRLLGVEPQAEGIFAVIPLIRPDRVASGAQAVSPGPQPVRPATIGYTDQERSDRVIEFETVTTVHLAALDSGTDRPAPTALRDAIAGPPRERSTGIPLPAPASLDAGVRAAVQARRSSFGRFSATDALSTGQLGTILAASVAASRFECDIAPDGLDLAKLFVFVNHVDGLAPGAYEYDPATHALHILQLGSRSQFLQRNYFLENYNLEQAGAVIVPTVRAAAVLDAVGDRGYRLTNAVIGAVAQGAYTAASALGIGCGVALGFDCVSYIEELGLAETGEAPLLIMMIGNERTLPANFRYEIA